MATLCRSEVKPYLGVFHDGVVEGFEGGADVLHHSLGDASQEAGLDGGYYGVDLPTDTIICITGAGSKHVRGRRVAGRREPRIPVRALQKWWEGRLHRCLASSD